MTRTTSPKNRRQNQASITLDFSRCDLSYCEDCRGGKLHEAAAAAGISNVDIDTDLQAVEAAWDKLDTTVGTKTREPITEIMRLAGDYHYNYAWGSLAVEYAPRVEKIAQGADMKCRRICDDTLIIKHRLPTCGRIQRIRNTVARARRKGQVLYVVGWPSRTARS